jgi:hypothetical protein
VDWGGRPEPGLDVAEHTRLRVTKQRPRLLTVGAFGPAAVFIAFVASYGAVAAAFSATVIGLLAAVVVIGAMGDFARAFGPAVLLWTVGAGLVWFLAGREPVVVRNPGVTSAPEAELDRAWAAQIARVDENPLRH